MPLWTSQMLTYGDFSLSGETSGTLMTKVSLPSCTCHAAISDAKALPVIVIYVDADTGRSYTYRQTHDTAVKFGKGLKSAWGWQKGDVLALYTPNSVDT